MLNIDAALAGCSVAYSARGQCPVFVYYAARVSRRDAEIAMKSAFGVPELCPTRMAEVTNQRK